MITEHKKKGTIAQVKYVKKYFEYLPAQRSHFSVEINAKVDADNISESSCIGPNKAKYSLKFTTQRGMISDILPLGHQYRSYTTYRIQILRGKFSTDTDYFKIKSLRGNIGSQVYSHKCGFNHAFHLPQDNY